MLRSATRPLVPRDSSRSCLNSRSPGTPSPPNFVFHRKNVDSVIHSLRQISPAGVLASAPKQSTPG